jgi:hypothetical protein
MPRGKPFSPGMSGNPAGRPPGRGLKAEIESALTEPRAGYIDRATLIAQKLVDMAEDGDIRAIELLLKRTWPEKMALETETRLHLIDHSGRTSRAVIDLADPELDDPDATAPRLFEPERNEAFAKAISVEPPGTLPDQVPAKPAPAPIYIELPPERIGGRPFDSAEVD